MSRPTAIRREFGFVRRRTGWDVMLWEGRRATLLESAVGSLGLAKAYARQYAREHGFAFLEAVEPPVEPDPVDLAAVHVLTMQALALDCADQRNHAGAAEAWLQAAKACVRHQHLDPEAYDAVPRVEQAILQLASWRDELLLRQRQRKPQVLRLLLGGRS